MKVCILKFFSGLSVTVRNGGFPESALEAVSRQDFIVSVGPAEMNVNLRPGFKISTSCCDKQL